MFLFLYNIFVLNNQTLYMKNDTRRFFGFLFDSELKKKLKLKAVLEDRTMGDILNELVREYVVKM